MLPRNKRFLVVFILLLAGGIVGYMLKQPPTDIFNRSDLELQKQSATEDLYRYINREDKYLDLDGDGNKERVIAFAKEDSFFEDVDYGDFKGYIVAYNGSKEIARTPDSFSPTWTTLLGNMEAYQFAKDNQREFLRLTQVAGSHHFNNIFFGLEGDKLLPICKMERSAVEEVDDCVFFTSRGDLLIEDTNKDGSTELVEFVDEYPPVGGRGRGVIGGIYSWNGSYMKPQESADYNRLFNLIAKDYPDFISKFEIEDSGLERVKKLWRGESE